MPGHPFYESQPWRKARSRYLRLNPYCVFCKMLGMEVFATDVDHIKAITKGGAPLDPRNFRGMCKTHHSQKTFTLDSRAGATYIKPLVVTGPDGYPVHIEKA